jgi:hypothetical protein
MIRTAFAISFAAVLCAAAFTGCSDSSDGAGGGAGGQGGAAGGDLADCDAIAEVCHPVDGLSSDAHDCHEVSHANVAADCTRDKTRCVALCDALAQGGAGGAGGHGGEHSH